MAELKVNRPRAKADAATLIAKVPHVKESPTPAPVRAPAPAVQAEEAPVEQPAEAAEVPTVSQETSVSQPDLEQLVEALGPPAAGGLFEGPAKNAISAVFEEKMAKAGVTWAEVQKSARVHRAANAAAETFMRVMGEPLPTPSPRPVRRDDTRIKRDDTPPAVRCLVLSMGAGCPGCVIVKHAIDELVDQKRFTAGDDATKDFQIYEWNSPGAAEARRKYRAQRFPTLVLVRPDGTEVARHVGGLEAEPLAKWLETSRENVARW